MKQQTLTPEESRRLYWLSGATCTGKTTISSFIAEQLNWNVFHCDDHEREQGQRADPKKHPIWHWYSRITGDELWFIEPEEHIRVHKKACDEQLDLIIEDLKHCLASDSRPLLYDGYVSPSKLLDLIPSAHHAYYMIPEENFQRNHYAKRAFVKRVLAKTSDPARAWENWMYRDTVGARVLREEVEQYDFNWHLVDGSLSVSKTADMVIAHFEGKNRA